MAIKTKTLGEYLKGLRENSKLSLNDVKVRTKIFSSSLSEWESDKHVPTKSNLEKLAKLYDVDINEFYKLIQFMGIPLFNRVQIGQFKNNNGENTNLMMFDEAIFQLTDIEDYFFTKKEDTSLDKIGIEVGSLILCRKTDVLDDKKIGIFILQDEAMMREIEYINDNEAYLIPHSSNENFKTIKVNLKEVVIVAKVEKVILDFK